MPAFPRRGAGSGSASSRARIPLSRRFTYRYALSIALFLAVGIGAKASSDGAMARLDDLTRQLTQASTQAPRVENITRLAAAVANQGADTDPATVDNDASRLEQEATALVKIQDGLLNGDLQLSLPDNPVPPELDAIYHGGDGLADRIRTIGKSAQRIADLKEDESGNDAARQMELTTILTLQTDAVKDLGDATRVYSTEVQDEIEHQKDLSQYFLWAAGGVAIFSVLVLFRPMARSIHSETTQLEAAERVHRENNERQTFRNDLSQRLELATNEPEVLDAAAQGLLTVVPTNAAEVLLTNASRTQLRREVVHPEAGPANCPVDDPNACAAIRRGQALTFESSRMLNVCPKLPQHAGVACSAVCVPLTFQGETLGVLHTTGPDNDPPTQLQADRLKVLGQETANHLGAVRAKATDQREARTDRLTGLLNRRGVEKKVSDLMRDGIPFSLAMADLDRFKQLNDAHGHEAGDRALQLFASLATSHLRPDDFAGRYGGEEFLVILPDTELDTAMVVLERLRSALAAEVAKAGAIPFTASWGLTDSTAGETLAQIVAVADGALYTAKREGRDRIVTDPGVAERAGGEPAMPDGVSAEPAPRGARPVPVRHPTPEP